jgi:predicted metal-dependent HD superfamily phosphohydrolase
MSCSAGSRSRSSCPRGSGQRCAAAADYDRYEGAIAEEYGFVPRELYRAGRARFLEKLLASAHIFLSEQFRTEREVQARENLRRALEQLR